MHTSPPKRMLRKFRDGSERNGMGRWYRRGLRYLCDCGSRWVMLEAATRTRTSGRITGGSAELEAALLDGA